MENFLIDCMERDTNLFGKHGKWEELDVYIKFYHVAFELVELA